MHTLLPEPVVPGDEQMRHLREIGDDGFAVNILAERDRHFRGARVPIFRLQQLAQRDFHFARIGELDADGVFAGDRRQDVDPLRARGAGEVALEADDFVHAHAFRRINFVAGDRRTFGDVAGRDLDSELLERVDQRLLNLRELRRDRRRRGRRCRAPRADRSRAARSFRHRNPARSRAPARARLSFCRALDRPETASFSLPENQRAAQWYRRLSARAGSRIPPA